LVAHSAKSALEQIKLVLPDLILCDFRLEDMTGTDFLLKLKQKEYTIPFIIITGYSDVKDAVEVMKLGAFDYVTKPLFPDEIFLTITQALNASQKTPISSNSSNDKLVPKNTDALFSNQFIPGISSDFAEIINQINLVAPTNFSIIIHGESGSGKEVIAKHIHFKSKRASKPFVAIDCGAISRELAGSELFGHEKGAFTGAHSQKMGSLEMANGGTIFLDEIANLPYDIQVALLRVVQERKIRRLGANNYIDLDVRIIVASNENLWEFARRGKFREDLFHRFNEFSINVPPLRNRKSDILHFANHFLQLTNAELEKEIKGFNPDVEKAFLDYVWFGNLRELKNVVKRAALLTESHWIELKSLPFEITNFKKLQFEESDQPIKPKIELNAHPFDLENKLKVANSSAEYNVILQALEQTDYNKTKAAQLLNIDRKTLYNKMKQFKSLNSN
jgi:two-component system response regulator HydG